jgi:hypothetical protein
MEIRANGISQLGRLVNPAGGLLSGHSQPVVASEEDVAKRISKARDLLLERLNGSDPGLTDALEDTTVTTCVHVGSSLIEGGLQSTRYFRAFDSTGDSRLSTLYLYPWGRFESADTEELAGEIERLLKRALAENRIPLRSTHIRSVAADALPVVCDNCRQPLRLLRVFSETLARYDCWMCRRCNDVLCPKCYPSHAHKVKLREKCVKCGGTGRYSQLVTKQPKLWERLLEVHPQYDLVTQACAECEGQGFFES